MENRRRNKQKGAKQKKKKSISGYKSLFHGRSKIQKKRKECIDHLFGRSMSVSIYIIRRVSSISRVLCVDELILSFRDYQTYLVDLTIYIDFFFCVFGTYRFTTGLAFQPLLWESILDSNCYTSDT